MNEPYRAKRLLNNEWAYGYYAPLRVFNCRGTLKVTYAIFEEQLGEVVYKDSNGVAAHPIIKTVNPKTLCRNTFVLDKNGNQIFEGDIVRTKYIEHRIEDEEYDYPTEFVEVVEYNNKTNGWVLKLMLEDIPMYRRLEFLEDARHIKLVELEVIGNIHDNTDLQIGIQ